MYKRIIARGISEKQEKYWDDESFLPKREVILMKYIMDIDVDEATMAQLRGTYTSYDHESNGKSFAVFKKFCAM